MDHPNKRGKKRTPHSTEAASRMTTKPMCKRMRHCIALFAGLLLLLTGGCILWRRTCPRWQAASLTLTSTDIAEAPYLDPNGMTQETRILPPEGYTRVPAAEDSLLAFLRAQPVYPLGTQIPVYDGSTANPVFAAAIYTLDLGAEGYQQCADSILRLYSEYFWKTGQPERIAFHFSNGFLCDYGSWRTGNRALVLGEFSCWIPIAGYDDSYQQFHNYLVEVMRYAGTLSLEAESTPISADEAHAGDLLCRGGTPGHAMLIVDEAVNAAGERCFLLGQGMIPAQSFHIIVGTDAMESPWYTAEQLDAEEIILANYRFNSGALRRWGEGFPNSQPADSLHATSSKGAFDHHGHSQYYKRGRLRAPQKMPPRRTLR